MCSTGKIKLSFKAACKQVRKLHDKEGKPTMRAYLCQRCLKYHVGHISENAAQAVLLSRRMLRRSKRL